MIRYGKSSEEYLKHKAVFYDPDANRRWSNLAKRIGALYCRQPPRDGCVVCGAAFGEPAFILHGAPYSLCGDCGHFNGHHEDTPEFAACLYEAGMNETAAVYADRTRASFMERVRGIYDAKVAFMCDALYALGEDPAALRYVDLGAGGGHFVAALREAGLTRAVGYETSKELVDGANALFGGTLLRYNALDALAALAATVEADVIAMIFSLEHVHAIRSFLSALRSNPRCRYFYFAVPTVSPSIALEALFPHVMPRVLGLGHTHLFSDQSLERICREFGLRRAAEWWFGANAFDLHRFVSVQLGERAETKGAVTAWNDMVLPLIDDLQLVFDKHRLSSEIHLVTAVER